MSLLRSDNGVIDLRRDGVLSVEIAQLASQIEAEVRDQYTDYIGVLARANNIAGVEWLVNVTCRNPYQTKIFDNFSKLKLLDHCIQGGRQINKVIVNGYGMRGATEAVCRKHQVRVAVEVDENDTDPPWFGLLSRVAILLYISLISFFVPRLLCGKKTMPDQPITYLDTFAKSSDFDSNGRFVDRYYPNMVALMEQSHAERVWYAPVIYSLRTPFDLKRFIDHAQQSSNHFLVMEQWLIGIDYLRALWLSFALPRRIVAIPEFCGADVSFMIRAEVAVDSFSTGLFGAILRYRFLDRLRRAGVEIEKVIDWSENQVVDRALCLATRDFYPGVKVIGYQGFIVSEHYLSHEPACYERDAGTIPDVICVVNKALLERKKKYCTEQRVAMAPAFRFKQLMNYHPVENREKDSILLALPVQVAIGRMIIHLALQMKQDSTFQFLVKLHPSVSRSAFLSEVPDANDSRFEFIENSLYDLFPSVALLISSDSSACFEAVSCGIRVVVIGNITGSTSNPLAGIISSDYWRVCYDSDCLMKVWSKRNQPFEIDSDASLMPVTRENVAGFLKL